MWRVLSLNVGGFGEYMSGFVDRNFLCSMPALFTAVGDGECQAIVEKALRMSG